MRRELLDQFWIVMACGAIFLWNLGAAGLWEEDEALYANCAREMAQRGDWVVPTSNGQLFVEKPPLMYWTMMAGFRLFGTNEFAARIGAALLGTAAALVTYHLGRRLFSARVGFWAGIILASTIGLTISARAATVDASLTLFTSLAMLAFVAGRRQELGLATAAVASKTNAAYRTAAARQPWLSALGMWTAMAIAVLAKGPVGLLLPATAIGLFLMLANARARRHVEDRAPCPRPRGHVEDPAASRPGREDVARPAHEAMAPWRGWQVRLLPEWVLRLLLNFLRSFWQMRPILGLAMVAAIAAPWYVLAGLRTGGQGPYEFFVKWNLRPFTQSIQGHTGPIWYHVVGVLLLFFPWSVFIWPTFSNAVRQGRRDAARRPAYVLLACWIGVWMVFWSLCKTKLPHYILPAYPALALLTACFLHGWLADPARAKRWEMPTALWTTLLAGLGFVVAVPIVARFFIPGEEILAVVGLPLVLGGALGLYFLRRAARLRMLAALTLGSIAFLALLFGFGAARVDRFQNARPLVAEIRQDSPGDFQLAGFQFLPRSFVYYAGDSVAYCSTTEQLRAFLARSEHPYVIAHDNQVDQIERALPGQLTEFARQRRFLRREDIVILSGSGDRIALGHASPPATR